MRHLRAWWRELCLATSENYVVNSHTAGATPAYRWHLEPVGTGESENSSAESTASYRRRCLRDASSRGSVSVWPSYLHDSEVGGEPLTDREPDLRFQSPISGQDHAGQNGAPVGSTPFRPGDDQSSSVVEGILRDHHQPTAG